jgi:hypothetical protein
MVARAAAARPERGVAVLAVVAAAVTTTPTVLRWSCDEDTGRKKRAGVDDFEIALDAARDDAAERSIEVGE